jgi:hypothetical protein
MFWANRTDKVAGVLLLLIVILSVVGFIAGTPLGEVDPFARADVDVMLRTIRDSYGLWTASLVPFVIQEPLIVAVAALLYIIFRDRSQSLALLGAFGLVAGAVVLMIHEAGAVTLAYLSADYLGQGGPGTISAGDPVILQAARTVSVGQAATALFGQTSLGLGAAAFGTLLLWAPEGTKNPPRWLGVAGLVAGFAMISTWLFMWNHLAGGGVTLIGELATLILFTRLAVWLIRTARQETDAQIPVPAAHAQGRSNTTSTTS